MSRLVTLTLVGTLWGLDGRPAARRDVWVSFQAGERPPLEAAPDALRGSPWAPFAAPVDPATGLPVAEPDPVPLFDSPVAGLSGLGVGCRHTTTDEAGHWALDVPSPSALCYAVGARTDADLDPARGGTYEAGYWALFGPAAWPIPFAVDEAAAVAGVLDVTQATAAPPL